MKRMVLTFLISFISLSIHAEESVIKSMEAYKYKFPLLLCLSDSYRSCYDDVSIEGCVEQLKKYRNHCDNPVRTAEYEVANNNFGEYSQCITLSHAGFKSLDEAIASNHCSGSVVIDLDKSNATLKSMDPIWVKKILQ